MKPAAPLKRIELEHLREQVERLRNALEEAIEECAPSVPGMWSPTLDLCETKTRLTVRVELPGVTADQIQIEIANKSLHIRGEKFKRETRRRAVEYLCSERNYGRFERTLPLRRWTLEPSAASAVLENGVLVITLPKRKERRGAEQRVEITERTNTFNVKLKIK